MDGLTAGRGNDSKDVTASEIATFAYCAAAWHLEHVQKVEPTPCARARRAAGIQQHERHGRLVGMQERLERGRIAVSAVLLLVALLALVGLFLAS